jgi:FtsZ-binding cell division protein ZapB|tara:strand:+ start:614 stop:919 length:306 start_codon:yes stop_codon:yes gene_type:complete
MESQQQFSQFNSNDMYILEKQLQDLQMELGDLENEEYSLQQEKAQMKDQTEKIKHHNKAIFHKITSNQATSQLGGETAAQSLAPGTSSQKNSVSVFDQNQQ